MKRLKVCEVLLYFVRKRLRMGNVKYSSALKRAISLAVVILALWQRSAAVSGDIRAVARLANGQSMEVTLVGWDGECFIFEEKGQQVQCAPGELVYWGRLSDLDSSSCLYLQNGSALTGKLHTFTGNDVQWRHPRLGELTFSRQACAGMVLKNPRNPAARDRLLKALLEDREGVLFLNGDQLLGRLVEWDQGDALKIQSDLGEHSIEVSAIMALRFEKPLTPAPQGELRRAPRLWIGLKDGSRLLISLEKAGKRSADAADRNQSGQDDKEGEAKIEGVLGGTLVNIPIAEISFIQILDGEVIYLSDRTPDQYVFVPFLEFVRPYYRDRNAKGGLLRVRKAVYLKGLGVYSASRLTYLLNKQFDRFEAEVAIDDLARGDGSVVFRVIADGQPRAVIGPVRGSDDPQPIQVDVRGVERLDLIVEFGERADELDFADWLNARLVPAQVSGQ